MAEQDILQLPNKPDKAEVHIEFVDGEPHIKKLSGKLPEGTKEHIKEVFFGKDEAPEGDKSSDEPADKGKEPTPKKSAPKADKKEAGSNGEAPKKSADAPAKKVPSPSPDQKEEKPSGASPVPPPKSAAADKESASPAPSPSGGGESGGAAPSPAGAPPKESKSAKPSAPPSKSSAPPSASPPAQPAGSAPAAKPGSSKGSETPKADAPKAGTKGGDIQPVTAAASQLITQDAGKAGEIPEDEGPPRVIPTQELGGPSIVQDTHPNVSTYGNPKAFDEMPHIKNAGDAPPIMDELVAQQQVEPFQVTPEDAQQLQALRDQIIDAAHRGDHRLLDQLHVQFLELKERILGETPEVPPAEGEPPPDATGGPIIEGVAMDEPVSPDQPLMQDPTAFDPTHMQAVPERRSQNPGDPLDVEPVGELYAPEVPPMEPGYSAQQAQEPRDELFERLAGPDIDVVEDDNDRPPMRAAKSIFEGVCFYGIRKGMLTPGEDLDFFWYGEALDDLIEKAARSFGSVSQHTGRPGGGHKYIKKWLQGGKWHYAYTDEKEPYHGLGKMAMHATAHGIIHHDSTGAIVAHTIPIHQALLPTEHGGIEQHHNKVKDAEHAYRLTVKLHERGAAGVEASPKELQWHETDTQGNIHQFQQRADKNFEVGKITESGEVTPQRISSLVQHATEHHGDLLEPTEGAAATKRGTKTVHSPDGKPWLTVVHNPRNTKTPYSIKQIGDEHSIFPQRRDKTLPFESERGAIKMAGALNGLRQALESGKKENISIKWDIPEKDSRTGNKWSSFEPDSTLDRLERGVVPYRHTQIGSEHILTPMLTQNEFKEMLQHPRMKQLVGGAINRAVMRAFVQKKAIDKDNLGDMAHSAINEALSLSYDPTRKASSTKGLVPGTGHVMGLLANTLMSKRDINLGGALIDKGEEMLDGGEGKGAETAQVVSASGTAEEAKEAKYNKDALTTTKIRFLGAVHPRDQKDYDTTMSSISHLAESEKDPVMGALLKTYAESWFKKPINPKHEDDPMALLHDRMKELHPEMSEENRDDGIEYAVRSLLLGDDDVMGIYNRKIRETNKSMTANPQINRMVELVKGLHQAVESGVIDAETLARNPVYRQAIDAIAKHRKDVLVSMAMEAASSLNVR